MIIHRVALGDTVSSIANSYNTSAERILSDNFITPDTTLVPGQELVIIYPDRIYTVKEGDTLFSIADENGVSTNELLRLNPALQGNPLIYPGLTITIAVQDKVNREIVVNGYAYPFIDQSQLRRALPYLTYLTVFTYGFNDAGELIPADDNEIVSIAKSYGVDSLLLISTLGEDGKFNNQLSKRLFASTEAQDTLISNLLDAVSRVGYSGVEVDFEFIEAEDKDGYVRFLERLAASLRAEGYKLFVALAPKTSDGQPGLLYEGHDYLGIGEVADYVILMTYEWGYRFGPPGAVAPIKNVERVVNYALTRIPADKILLGIPNYGYDWPLPFVQGESAAEGLGIVPALDRAREKGASIYFDQDSKAPYYSYSDNGVEHIVWLENASSIREKLLLVEKYSLAGISIWTIMRYFPQLYAELRTQFGIG